jgi:hypothetical protein
MKPLEKIKEVTNGVNLDTLNPDKNREIFKDIASQPFGCVVKLKDGTFLNVTLKNAGFGQEDTIEIEKVEPYYEFDDENEIRKYLTIDKEEFENFIRWQKLNNILDEEDQPLK